MQHSLAAGTAPGSALGISQMLGAAAHPHSLGCPVHEYVMVHHVLPEVPLPEDQGTSIAGACWCRTTSTVLPSRVLSLAKQTWSSVEYENYLPLCTSNQTAVAIPSSGPAQESVEVNNRDRDYALIGQHNRVYGSLIRSHGKIRMVQDE